MASRKRPLGLKAQHRSHKLKTAHNPGVSGEFATVALQAKNQDLDDGSGPCGLTIEDVLQLKEQAGALLEGLQASADAQQLASLLRGICHECVRQVELAESAALADGLHGSSEDQDLLHRLIAWATLELCFVLTLDDLGVAPEDGEDRPLEEWLGMVSKAMDHSSSHQVEHPAMAPSSDLGLLPIVVALARGSDTDQLAGLWTKLKATLPTSSPAFVIRMVDRLLWIHKEAVRLDPDSFYPHLVEIFEGLRSTLTTPDSPEKAEGLVTMIDDRLGSFYLACGSSLADQLEAEFSDTDHGDEGEEQARKESDKRGEDELREPHFHRRAIQYLEAAITKLSDRMARMEKDDPDSELVRDELNEALLTLGNFTPPGPKRQALYDQAGCKELDGYT